MNYQKLNVEAVGISNKKLVLNLIRKGEITRREISKISGLNPSTVTKIVKFLIESNLCFEKGQKESKNTVGRKAINLSINPTAYQSLIVRIGVQKTEIGRGYFDGNVEIIENIRSTTNIANFVSNIKKVSDKITESIPEENFLGVSVSVPGMVDTEKAFVIDVPHLGWKNLYVNDYVDTSKGLFLDNEANLSLIAESWLNPLIDGLKNIVFLYLSEGIGCGIMIDGKIYRGNTYSAAEFGHMSIQQDGPQCYCGNSGCWETLASTEAFVKKYRSIGGYTAGCNYNEQFSQIVDQVERDELAKDTLKHEEELLAIGIVNIVNSLNPEAVVLGGMAGTLSEQSIKRILKLVNQRVLYALKDKIKIVKSYLDQEGKIVSPGVGATLMIIDRNIQKIIS
ncbi:MAG: ROK family transcriptional regulator [Kosmotoga sp.]|nr:MAG: ROK family transcriptional regulator [Kosmotoga sp.]